MNPTAPRPDPLAKMSTEELQKFVSPKIDSPLTLLTSIGVKINRYFQAASFSFQPSKMWITNADVVYSLKMRAEKLQEKKDRGEDISSELTNLQALCEKVDSGFVHGRFSKLSDQFYTHMESASRKCFGKPQVNPRNTETDLHFARDLINDLNEWAKKNP